jgi:hypothetical protein
MQPYEAALKIHSQKLSPELVREKILIFNSAYSMLSYDIISLNKLNKKHVSYKEYYLDYFRYERFFNETKLLWLFEKDALKKVSEDKDKLMFILIKHCSPDLGLKDYILLLYISLQNNKMRKSLDGIPLSMLHEMYEPVADAKIKAWCKKVEN